MKKSWKYRLSPTRKQAETLQWTLDRTRELYNAALQERRDAYRMAHKRINYYKQANQLPDIKEIREEYKAIHSQVLQDVLRRVDKAMQAFFRRVKSGETPGYPRFQGRDRYDSFTYPQAGFSLTHENRVLSFQDWQHQSEAAQRGARQGENLYHQARGDTVVRGVFV